MAEVLCIKCGSTKIVTEKRYGGLKEIQKCRSCGKTQNPVDSKEATKLMKILKKHSPYDDK